MYSETAINIIELYDVVEIIEDTADYCVGITADGQSFRFEPSAIGDCITVSWED